MVQTNGSAEDCSGAWRQSRTADTAVRRSASILSTHSPAALVASARAGSSTSTAADFSTKRVAAVATGS